MKFSLVVILFLPAFLLYPALAPGQATLEWQQLENQLIKLRKEGNKTELTRLLTQAGFKYWSENNSESAVEYFEEALEINQESGNQHAEGILLNHLGMIYSEMKQYEKARELFSAALNMHNALGNKNKEAAEYLNLGLVFKESKNYIEAISALKNGLTIAKEVQEQKLIHRFFGALAELYQELDSTDRAMEYYNLYLAIEKHLQEELRVAQQKEAHLKVQMAEAKQQAVEHEKKVTENKLSTTEEALNSAIRLGIEKEIQIDLLNKENRIKELTVLEQQAQLKSEKIFRNSIIGGSVMLSFLLLVAYSGYTQKKSANKKLGKQNDEISQQRDQIKSQSLELARAFTEIRETNTKINRSIQYAKRIQDAMLNHAGPFQKNLPDSFIFYAPRDIVSGDFYWFRIIEQQPGKMILIVADCTGHGVPGAFMSLIGNDLLHQTIFLKDITDPGSILQELHSQVYHTLQQERTNNMDGMDMGICLLDLNEKRLTFSGARIPLVMIKDQKTELLSGMRSSVGGFPITPEKKFQNHTINIIPGTTFYMFSDGFQDQFGGAHGEKYSHQNLLHFLQKCSTCPLDQQAAMISREWESWTGGKHKQIDDMLIVGFKVS